MLDGDVVALDALLAEDMAWVHASSKRDSKNSFLEGFATGTLRCFQLQHSDITIQILDGTALVTGIVQMDVAVLGERRNAANRFAAVWTSGASEPKLLYWQSTKLVS